ncbi:hypothetical protein D3C83_16220 [compost metagenome]
MSPFDLFTMVWMLRLAFAIAVEICPTMFGTLAFAMPTRNGASRAIVTSGKFTALTMLPFSRKSRTWSTTMTAQLSSASRVEAPRCGSMITWGCPASFCAGKSQT